MLFCNVSNGDREYTSTRHSDDIIITVGLYGIYASELYYVIIIIIIIILIIIIFIIITLLIPQQNQRPIEVQFAHNNYCIALSYSIIIIVIIIII